MENALSLIADRLRAEALSSMGQDVPLDLVAATDPLIRRSGFTRIVVVLPEGPYAGQSVVVLLARP